MIDFVNYIPAIIFSLLITLVIWALYKQTQRRLYTYITTTNRKLVIHLVCNIIQVLLITLGITMVFAQWGIDISALLAGLSITGFALSFALKDILSCIVAGIIVILYRPFNDGDCIEILGIKGKVIDINLKYTAIDSDEATHLIPNSKLLSERITIFKNPSID